MSEPIASVVERRERIAKALFDVWAKHDRIWSLAERADAWEKKREKYVGIWAQADAVMALDAAPAPPAEVEAALVEWQKRCVANHGEPGLLADEWADLLATVTVLVDTAVRQERERIRGRLDALLADVYDGKRDIYLVDRIADLCKELCQEPRP